MKPVTPKKTGLRLHALACVLAAAGTVSAWGAQMPAGADVWMVFESNACGTAPGEGLCDTSDEFGAAGGIPMQFHELGSWGTGYAQAYPDRTQSYLAGYDAGFIWISMHDTYTVHGSAAGPFDITANLDVDGVANSIWLASSGKHWLYAGSVTVEIGTFDPSTASPYSEQFRITPFFEWTPAATRATFETGTHIGSQTTDKLVKVSTSYTKKSVLVGDSFELGYGVNTSLVVGELDLRNTGRVSFTLPEGVWLTSANGATFGSPTPVPEPASYAMMLAGLGLLALVARRRKQRAA